MAGCSIKLLSSIRTIGIKGLQEMQIKSEDTCCICAGSVFHSMGPVTLNTRLQQCLFRSTSLQTMHKVSKLKQFHFPPAVFLMFLPGTHHEVGKRAQGSYWVGVNLNIDSNNGNHFLLLALIFHLHTILLSQSKGERLLIIHSNSCFSLFSHFKFLMHLSSWYILGHSKLHPLYQDALGRDHTAVSQKNSRSTIALTRDFHCIAKAVRSRTDSVSPLTSPKS